MDLYRVNMNGQRFDVKCRPFLADFMLSMLPHYQIFFYTAGIYVYGKVIMEVIKDLILKEIDRLPDLYPKDKYLGAINQTFKEELRLISRND